MFMNNQPSTKLLFTMQNDDNYNDYNEQNAQHTVHLYAKLPWATIGIISLCIAVYILSLLQSHPVGGFFSPSDTALINLGALVGERLRAGEWWRLLTVALLHGSIIHLGMNMLALYYLGPTIENWQGSWRLLIAFTTSVIIGSLASYFWHTNVFSVGASGGIFGLLGFLVAILLRYYRNFPPHIRKSLTSYLRSILIMNILISFLPQIDFAAHIGGLIGGFVIGLIIATSPFKYND